MNASSLGDTVRTSFFLYATRPFASPIKWGRFRLYFFALVGPFSGFDKSGGRAIVLETAAALFPDSPPPKGWQCMTGFNKEIMSDF